MPNWAYTNYKITGDEEELQSLYDRMKQLQEMKEPLKPNGFGTTWLGNLVEDLGVDFTTVQCRGSWDCLDLDDDILSFTTETAWYRCTEVEDLLKEKYPSLEIAFLCEESGIGIYEKNSDEFFPEDYIIDIVDEDCDYCTEEDALSIISDFFGIDFETMDEAKVLIQEDNALDEPNIYLRKIQLI